jgi:hypothetical protein
MKRKKQGAALIVVIIVFMFVFTVSTAMLSMAASNYKARVSESNKVQNLYASDSGLDVAYNVIGKTFDAATKYANLKVTQLKSINTTSSYTNNDTSIYNIDYATINDDIKYFNDDITKAAQDTQDPPSDIENRIAKDKALIKEDENIQEALCNEEFKRSFKNFIKAYTYTPGDPIYDKTQGRLGSGETAPNELEALIEGDSPDYQPQYISEILDINKNTFTKETVQFNISNKNKDTPQLSADVNESPITGTSYPSTGIIKTDNGHHYDVSFTVYGDEYFDIAVTSSFYTEKINQNETNQRQLKATYRMLVPDYKDIYFQNSNGNLNQYLATKDRALTIFGNMNVNNVSALKVSGDIFVQGSVDESANDRVYGKYFGGITLNNSDGVDFKNNVITRGTFNIENTTTSASVKTTTLDENLYARNVYVGKIDNSNGLANANTLLSIDNQVIINNDLALNADNAKINIGDLYGINDENDKAKAESSSSIIVNGNDNSSINITNSAYLMGTAHIATSGDYQTAESGAVKGNYIAYSVPLTEAQKSKYGITWPEQFSYYNPLQLLSPTDSSTDQQQKELHFRAYWDGGNPNAGGIIWPHNSNGSINQDKIWSIGVIIYQNGATSQVIPSHYKADLESSGPVYDNRVKFAQYAYKFGQNADIDDYNKGTTISNSSIIDTDKIPSGYVLGNQQNKGEYAIFNGNSSKEIKITKSTGSEDVIDTATDPNVINIQVGNSGTLHAVIATAGKVSIESGITIDGCIIAEGDLNIDSDNVTINYDSGVIGRVQAQNVDTFNAVFGSSIVADTNNSASGTSDTGSATTNYNLKNFLENKLWKILK